MPQSGFFWKVALVAAAADLEHVSSQTEGRQNQPRVSPEASIPKQKLRLVL